MNRGFETAVLLLLFLTAATLTGHDQLGRQSYMAVQDLMLQDRIDLNVRSCLYIAASIMAAWPSGWPSTHKSVDLRLNGRECSLKCRVRALVETVDANQSYLASPILECEVRDNGAVVAVFTLELANEGCRIIEFERYYAVQAQKAGGAGN